jgi:hypothetical protein
MTNSLNRIYYGPPGTGKTYSVTLEAQEIVKSAGPSRGVGPLSEKEKFDRILKLVRERYQTEEFKAKSNSVYRNERAIMWMLGYLEEANQLGCQSLTRAEAIARGMDPSPSTWAQLSQYMTQFRLVDNWKETSTVSLNKLGQELRNKITKSYDVETLKSWSQDAPEVIRSFYSEVFVRQKLDEFTPVLKMFFGALCMALHGELYKQNNEQRKPTDEERLVASRFFDLRANVTDLKWIGHLARTLQGLGFVELVRAEIDAKNFYKLTESGNLLVSDIIKAWEEDYPTIFQQSLSFDDAISLGLIHFITFHQSYSYEEFIEGLKPVLLESGDIGYEMVDGVFKSICSRATSDQSQNYVVIIDEINRGNISKIFGELITLIEPSKRLYQTPKENPQSVLLPYSRTKFSVPKNVYILGTMNSVDRSVTSIDTALRRRFEFVEVPPNPDLLKKISFQGRELDLANLLRTINLRIEYLLDRDHLLGHSYFMRVVDFGGLCRVFTDNLIPLLEEYFLGDWRKVALVLGDTPAFQKSDSERFLTQSRSTFSLLFKEADDTDDNLRYRLNPTLQARKYEDFPIEAFIKSFELNA